MAGSPKKRERKELAERLAAGVSLTWTDPHEDDSLLVATDRAIAEGRKAGILTSNDDGAIELLRHLAKKIDAWETIVEWALDDAAEYEGNVRPKVPAHDNTTPGTYAKLAESLGLTPSGRHAIGAKSGETSGKAGKLTALRNEARGRAAG